MARHTYVRFVSNFIRSILTFSGRSISSHESGPSTSIGRRRLARAESCDRDRALPGCGGRLEVIATI